MRCADSNIVLVKQLMRPKHAHRSDCINEAELLQTRHAPYIGGLDIQKVVVAQKHCGLGCMAISWLGYTRAFPAYAHRSQQGPYTILMLPVNRGHEAVLNSHKQGKHYTRCNNSTHAGYTL